MDSLLNSIRHLKEKEYQLSLNFSMKKKGKEHHQTHSMKPALPSSPKQTRTQKKKRTAGQSVMKLDGKILNQILAN
jgi:hypothetical protein